MDKIYVYMTGRSAHEKAAHRLRERNFLQEKVETNVRHIVRGRKISISDAIVRYHRARLSGVSVSSRQAKRSKEKKFHLGAIMDPASARRNSLRSHPSRFFSFSTSSRIIFHFFWHIFLGCLHILCIKVARINLQWREKNFWGTTCRTKKERRKLFVLDNFQGYEDFLLVQLPFASTYTRRKTCGCLETREGKVIPFFFLFCGRKRYDCDIKTATCWRQHKCLAMMEKSIFRRVTSSIISCSLSRLRRRRRPEMGRQLVAVCVHGLISNCKQALSNLGRFRVRCSCSLFAQKYFNNLGFCRCRACLWSRFRDITPSRLRLQSQLWTKIITFSVHSVEKTCYFEEMEAKLVYITIFQRMNFSLYFWVFKQKSYNSTNQKL